jgi:creatinine amidohydrolase
VIVYSGDRILEHALMNLTQPEAEDLLRKNPLVVIPTGSVEQHGPHLPFGTDYFASLVISQSVANDLDALLLPFTPLGVTPIHMSFVGTLSLKPETYMSMLTDVCESIIQHGAEQIVVINWHELNKPLIDIVASRMQEKHSVRFILVQAHFVALELFGQQVGLTHGGLLEALPVLAYDPKLAKLERATNASSHEVGSKFDRLRRRREVYTIFGDVREVYPTGWYGTVDGANIEKAQEFVQAVSKKIVDYVMEAIDVLSTNTNSRSNPR